MMMLIRVTSCNILTLLSLKNIIILIVKFLLRYYYTCRFKIIWTVQKDAFFRRWRAQDPRVSDFDQAITQYIELSNKAQQVDTLTNVEFILLDCSPLKFSIISHCEEWQNRFHNLLLDLASNKLNEICTFLSENSKK